MNLNESDEPRHLVVIGASAGGLSVLDVLVGQLKEEWDAAFLIVLHLSHKGVSKYLLQRIQELTSLHCILGADKLPILKGNIYISPADYHLMVEKGKVRIGYGPPENRWRPSIDVLFRSAAATYGSQVTGIILTGLLNDGVSGMWAIKRCKGTVIVQDPREAEYPDMPLSVLNNMEVDYSVSASKMGEVLEEVFQSKVFNEVAIPQDVVSEAEIAAKMATGIEEARPLGDQSVYTCPDCGGLLWEIKGGAVTKYRCHTGHSYTEEDLIIKQSENVENTLWVALRMMEERRNLLKRMEQQTRERGFSRFANDHFAKAAELERHIGRLKELLKIVHDHNDT